MFFELETCNSEDDNNENFLDEEHSEEDTDIKGMDFEIETCYTEDDNDENFLDEDHSEEDTDEEAENNNQKEIKVQYEDTPNNHPLAHLFDEPLDTKTPVKKSNLASTSGAKNKKNSGNDSKLLEQKLLHGLTKSTKTKILPLLKNQRRSKIDELLEKSEILNMNLEEQSFTINPQMGKKKLKKIKKAEEQKTKGDKWFGLPATEMTEEVKRELEIMKMRSVLDPKHFYKRNQMKVLPKYFQIGKVVDSPLDFYNNRLTKKERKKSRVDLLMNDAEFNHYNKSKYSEILKEKQKTNYKSWKQAKNLKKRK